jgi:serine/threonine protein kinase
VTCSLTYVCCCDSCCIDFFLLLQLIDFGLSKHLARTMESVATFGIDMSDHMPSNLQCNVCGLLPVTLLLSLLPHLLLLLQLIDFGLSKHLESVATLGVGTPDYMPPEMVRSQVKAQQRSQQMRAAAAGAGGGSSLSPHGGKAPPYDAKKVDAWAMGVLLYLLVTGTYPFEVSVIEDRTSVNLEGVCASSTWICQHMHWVDSFCLWMCGDQRLQSSS